MLKHLLLNKMKGNKMSTFKKLFATLVLVLFVTSVSMAQVNKNYDGVKPELRKGAHSLVFMYTPFQSNLGPIFAGSHSNYNSSDTASMTTSSLYGIGYRYYFDPAWSLMGGISFGYTSTDLSGGSKTTIMDYGISLDLMRQFKPLYSIAAYVGLNANIGSHKWEYEAGDTTNSTTTSTGMAFGGGLGVGFDWYFTEGMSLGGKYTLGIKIYSAPEVERTGTYTLTGPDRTAIGFGHASVYLNVHLP